MIGVHGRVQGWIPDLPLQIGRMCLSFLLDLSSGSDRLHYRESRINHPFPPNGTNSPLFVTVISNVSLRHVSHASTMFNVLE